jgi:outer membrane protein assembly factor BamB
VAENRIYIGIHEANLNNNSLFCYELDGTTLVWEKKIGMVLSNITVDNGKLYVTGNQTFYCLNAAGGAEYWNVVMTADSISKPVVSGGKVYLGNGDKLYVSCENGLIYCFGL